MKKILFLLSTLPLLAGSLSYASTGGKDVGKVDNNEDKPAKIASSKTNGGADKKGGQQGYWNFDIKVDPNINITKKNK